MNGHLSLLAVLALLLFAGWDVLNSVGGAAQEQAAPAGVDGVDQGRSLGGRVHVSYCTSWSFKGAYIQVAQLVEQRYPWVEVTGSTYPVPFIKQAAVRVVWAAQAIAMALVFYGQRLLPAFGVEVVPELLARMQQSKFAAVMGIWLVGNTVVNALMSTGAFEIFCDGSLIFSKLAEERMPQLQELYSSMDMCMEAFRTRTTVTA